MVLLGVVGNSFLLKINHDVLEVVGSSRLFRVLSDFGPFHDLRRKRGVEVVLKPVILVFFHLLGLQVARGDLLVLFLQLPHLLFHFLVALLVDLVLLRELVVYFLHLTVNVLYQFEGLFLVRRFE